VTSPATTGPDLSRAGEMNLALLVIAYPQFAITAIPGRRRPRWEVVRRNSADPGLYAIITDNLTEAYQAMAADAPPAIPLPPAASLQQVRP
jgi:hypothetical protein